MTLKDIASQLNLSVSTVAKALRDSPEISEATKKTVSEKAKALNYQVNSFASSLRRTSSKTIAVIVSQINDFLGTLMEGIEYVAHEKGYHVLIYLTHDDLKKEVAITKLLQNGKVDGIMMSITQQTTSQIQHLEELKEKDIPLVLIDHVIDTVDAPQVITNDYDSCAWATEHLIKNGCKRIAFLAISQTSHSNSNRINGYMDTLKKHNLPVDDTLFVNCTGSDMENKGLIRKLLAANNKPDGILATVEQQAIDIYEICHELNLNIPYDIKVACFSNSKAASVFNPPLTTINKPAYEIGREAAIILFKLLEKKRHHFLLEKTVINSKLEKRLSTGNNCESIA
jgi:LacI family transcriptional regulator